MTNRRSTRKPALKKKDDDYEEHEVQSDASVVEIEPPVPKRRAKRKAGEVDQSTREQVEAFNSKKPKYKKGYLQQVAEMPIDVVFEIFAKLDPFDLLNLSRTSKALRGILMSKTSISVWRDARANVAGLPDCPDELTEPQYADLVFGKNCTICGKASQAKVVTCYQSSLRVCSRCIQAEEGVHFIRQNDLDYEYWKDGKGGKVRDSYVNGWTVGRVLPTFDLVKFKALTAKGKGKSRINPYQYNQDRFHIKTVMKWKKEYLSLNSTAEQEKWYETKKAHKAARRHHAEAIETFAVSYHKGVATQKAATVEVRMSMLADRVKELGWSEELTLQGTDAVSVLKTSKIIEAACMKDISTRGFKALENEINRVFSELKSERLLEEHTAKLKQTVDVLREILARCIAKRPLGEAQPSVGDFFDLYRIRSACIECAQDPDSQAATVLQFVEDEFMALRELCIKRCRMLLLEMLDTAEKERKKKEKGNKKEKKTKEAHPQVDGLELATSFFQCTWCQAQSLRFPNILAHSCARGADVGSGEDWVSDALSTRDHPNSDVREGLWNSRAFIRALPEIHMASLLAVLDLWKLDPKTTTFDEVEKMQGVVECLSCNSFSKGRCLMDWTGITTHVEKSDKSHKFETWGVPAKWAIVEDEGTAAIARKRIADAYDMECSLDREYWGSSIKEDSIIMMCTVSGCGKTGDLMGLRNHIREDHRRLPEEGDVIRIPGMPKGRPFVHVWPPREDQLALDLSVTTRSK